MDNADLPDFGRMLDAVCSLLSRGAYQPSAMNTALFFRALAPHSLAEVRAAFDAHVADPTRGRFVPVPADLIAQIAGHVADDGRPGPEEAWATAVRGVDEFETVVWTAETADAFAIARPVLQAGDDVGARMAFRESYARLVDAARRERRPVEWSASLGFDPERRGLAIAAAIERNLLPASAMPMLSAPRGPVLLLGEATGSDIPDEACEALLALRDWLMAPQAEFDPAAEDRAETARQKANAAQLVRDHQEPLQ